MFWNLFSNAVKFTPEEGTITVRSRRESTAAGCAITVEITDTGIGIEPEALETVFDAFQQGETTITRRFGGLGLGLTISQAIVEIHGGSLSAESAGKDQGATFVDLGLPDGSGLDLMQEIHRRYGVPGIALSGYGMEDDVRKSLNAGFERHLTKPVNLQALQTAIQEILPRD